jgi:hypothetical protein
MIGESRPSDQGPIGSDKRVRQILGSWNQSGDPGLRHVTTAKVGHFPLTNVGPLDRRYVYKKKHPEVRAGPLGRILNRSGAAKVH